MSTPTDRRISLGKYVKRMSSVFRREKSTKSVAGDQVTSPQTEQSPAAKEEVVPAVTAVPEAISTTTPAKPKTVVTTRMLNRSAMQQERARILFAKYGLTLEAHEWIAAPTPVPTVQRVEKSIRMRVHRSCHHCGTLYGSEKVCLQCEHKRCKKCPRYPKKRTATAADKEASKAIAERPKKKRALTLTTRGGQEVTYQPVKQRIRRTCHKCEMPFIPATATTCEQCRHVRCTKCPRDPAKLQKWPSGYPGDREPDSDSEVEKQLEKFRRTWRKPRQRVRWECEQCHGHFLHGSPQCPGCGHERCDKCTRSPIKKTKQEERFDPQLVAAVEAKLRALDVEDTGPDTA